MIMESMEIALDNKVSIRWVNVAETITLAASVWQI